MCSVYCTSMKFAVNYNKATIINIGFKTVGRIGSSWTEWHIPAVLSIS